MTSASTVTLRGEGGVEWSFDLPLSEVLRDQVEAGSLQPVDNESAELLEDLFDDEDGEPDEVEDVVEVTASPAAAKLAEELGVDLDEVPGTGKDGAITKGDVAAYAESDDDEDGEPDEG